MLKKTIQCQFALYNLLRQKLDQQLFGVIVIVNTRLLIMVVRAASIFAHNMNHIR